ncbi:hypothetical protein FE697_018100 [Mumia zhuanghuii]|uniref:DUF4337 domain-containing protein n=2 Tax=Mumia TaxID=1546255 RepID=A0ABW1QLQ8_9ACTN|nr:MULTISPECIES: hypothetical protein [Mumia]KAA1419818.1 hypothetical protein FE697_018100 [Mumia zhuanghuii]
MAEHAEPSRERGTVFRDLVVTVLLVVAAVATSWSSYQAARWHGEQAEAASRTSAIRFEAAREQGLAEAQNEIDVATFIAWVDADRTGEPELAAFYEARFRPEFQPAFEAWKATDPFTDRAAPPTPFAMPEYDVAASAKADQLDREADASAAEVREDIQRAGNYVLTVVLYAVALFFAGMSTKIGNRRLQTVMIVAGYVVLVGAIAWVATFPVSIAV